MQPNVDLFKLLIDQNLIFVFQFLKSFRTVLAALKGVNVDTPPLVNHPFLKHLSLKFLFTPPKILYTEGSLKPLLNRVADPDEINLDSDPALKNQP